METSGIAIVVPAYNEGRTISKVVNDLGRYGLVIVVDDCSTDDTRVKAEAAGAIVLTHDANKGYDGALNTGFEKAASLNCSYIITFDADGQHDPLLIGEYLSYLQASHVMVAGVRPCCARVAEKIFSMVSTILWGLKDPLCGMKGYNLSAYLEQGFFDSYGSIGTELALFIAKRKYPFKQIEISIKNREGQPRFGNLIRANLKIFRAMILGVVKYN